MENATFFSVKSTFLLKKLQMSWFHGNILQKMINLIFSWLFPYYNVEDFSSNQLFSKSNVDFTEKVWEWISMYIHMYVQFLHCALIKYQITSLGTTNKRTKIHYSNSSSIYNLKTQVRICRLPRNWNYYCSSEWYTSLQTKLWSSSWNQGEKCCCEHWKIKKTIFF